MTLNTKKYTEWDPYWVVAHAVCLVAQLCWTVCDPMDCSPPGSSVLWDSPGKNTRVDCRFLLQGIFWTQGLNLSLLHSRLILSHLSHQRLGGWVALLGHKSVFQMVTHFCCFFLNIVTKSVKAFNFKVYGEIWTPEMNGHTFQCGNIVLELTVMIYRSALRIRYRFWKVLLKVWNRKTSHRVFVWGEKPEVWRPSKQNWIQIKQNWIPGVRGGDKVLILGQWCSEVHRINTLRRQLGNRG